MKRASLLAVGITTLALNACIKIEMGGTSAPQPAAPPAQAAATPQAPAAAAPTCNSQFAAGSAVGGQAVTVDLCTVKQGTPQAIAFVYYLGQEKIESSADCPGGNWTTYPERQVHYPKSTATQTMLNAVCQQAGHTAAVAPAPAPAPAPAAVAPAPAPAPAAIAVQTASGAAVVFDPPSNVRVSPGGAILCSVKARKTIRLTGVSGSWYRTSDACGSTGFIHESQLRFI